MITIEQALESIKDRKEFSVKIKNDTIIINYLFALQDSFQNGRENLRGITFDQNTKELLSLPFQKFFNINEKEFTQYNLIKNLNATIYEKLDGSLIHFYMQNNTLFASTKNGTDTPQAKKSLQILDNKTKKLIIESIENNYTPLFEYCSPNNQIVVPHTKESLIYLISRNKSNGSYHFNEKFENKAKRFEFKLKEIYENLNDQFEGYVCHLENNQIVKIKTQWYLDRHPITELIFKPKYHIYEAHLNQILDDYLIPDKLKLTIEEIKKEVDKDLIEYYLLIKNITDEIKIKYSSIKEFAIEAQKQCPELFNILITFYKEKDISKFIKNKLLLKYKEKYNHPISNDLTNE